MLTRRISAALAAVAMVVTPASAAQAAGPSARDVNFLRTTTQLHLAAIEQGRIARDKAQDAEVKAFAGNLMATHIRLNAALGIVAWRLKVSLPIAPSAAQQALISRYEAAPAAKFDKIFLSTQESAHRAAAAAAAAQAASGDDAGVKDVAKASVAVLNKQVNLIGALD